MMRRMKCLFLLLVMLCAAAYAEGSQTLPQAVIDLCAQVHPGYAIAAHDGWGDEDRGQYALILSRDGDNILCMAEKAAEDAAYQLTIDNTNAVYDGDVLPSLMIDSGGDSLFYTYHDEWRSLHIHAVKTDSSLGNLTHAVGTKSAWSDVDVTLYKQASGEYCSIWSALGDGLLRYEHAIEDENGNILDRWYDVPVLVSESAEEQMLLDCFDINLYDPDPSDGLFGLVETPGFTREILSEGDVLEQLEISRVHLAALISRPSVGTILTISEWDGARYIPIQALGLDAQAYLDTYHAGEGTIHITNGDLMYTVCRIDAEKWYLTAVDPDTQRTIGPDWANVNEYAQIGRNGGYIYGDTQWDDFSSGHIDLPSTYEEALSRMDTSAYALVHNPNPADRLHLRAKPDKGSHSYGKFYNRTPVLVLERGDTWTRVQIGRGGAAMTGYMMTQYLAFDDNEKAQLACAFPQVDLREEHQSDGVRMYAEPKSGAVTERVFGRESGDFIIGVSGDEWYVVLRADGAVGYVPQSAFWAGNG